MSATISLADGAPEGAGVLTVANDTVNVQDGPQEVSNETLIAAARNLPQYFTVEESVEESETVEEDYDASDPHQNPAADHLSVYGSDAAVNAADANDLALQVDHYGGEDNLPFVSGSRVNPTVAESVQATFNSQGIQDAPQVAETGEAAAPQGSPEPAAPAPNPAPQRNEFGSTTTSGDTI